MLIRVMNYSFRSSTSLNLSSSRRVIRPFRSVSDPLKNRWEGVPYSQHTKGPRKDIPVSSSSGNDCDVETGVSDGTQRQWTA